MRLARVELRRGRARGSTRAQACPARRATTRCEAAAPWTVPTTCLLASCGMLRHAVHGRSRRETGRSGYLRDRAYHDLAVQLGVSIACGRGWCGGLARPQPASPIDASAGDWSCPCSAVHVAVHGAARRARRTRQQLDTRECACEEVTLEPAPHLPGGFATTLPPRLCVPSSFGGGF